MTRKFLSPTGSPIRMAVLCDLVSAGIIEKDSHGDAIWAWSYPTVTKEQRDVYMKKCCLKHESNRLVPFIYGQYQKTWYYCYTTQLNSSALPKVQAASLILVTRDFNPEKYENLCQLLTRQYSKAGSPTTMLHSYLSVVTKGICNGEDNGTFSVKEFDKTLVFYVGSLKAVILRFGIETILIHTALMMKRRVAVYHPRVEELLSIVRTLPALVLHRQSWSLLYPYVHLDDQEIDDMTTNPSYVAGCTDAAIENRSDLYDLFVNANSNEISIAPHAKEAFGMGKLHKDLALFMMQCAEDDSKSDAQVVKDIASKTQDLLNNLRGLSEARDDGKCVITLEALKERKMPPATETYLFNLAAAEGWVPI